MGHGVKIHIWGEYALFSRPEMKVERCSYDVITPSAARGILEAIYWHPGMRWVIDKIYVRKPIAFTSIRRNEVKSKIQAANVLSVMNGGNKQLYIAAKEDIAQRAAVILKDVDYVIEAHFEMTDKASVHDNPAKFKEITMRRLRKGSCYHQPYFGCREFPVKFELYDGNEVDTAYSNEVKDLGYMLFDMDYSNSEDIKPLFFRAVLNNGILDLTDCEVIR